MVQSIQLSGKLSHLKNKPARKNIHASRLNANGKSPTLNKQIQSYLEAFVVDSFANIKGSKSIYIKNCIQKLLGY